MNDKRAEAAAPAARKPSGQPLEAVLMAILAAIVIVTFIQILFRYVLHLSLAWSEEIARYLFLWLASLASAYAFKTRSHFALTFLVDQLGKKARAWTDTLVVVVVSLFLVLFIWKSLEFSISMAGQIAPSTRIPMAIPYSSAWVGGMLMLYYVLRSWREGRRAKAGQGQEQEGSWPSSS